MDRKWMPMAMIVVVAVIAGVMLWIFTRKKKEAAPQMLSIEVRDSAGRVVNQSSPLTLIEEDSYTVNVSVTNMSTRLGKPSDVYLSVGVRANVGTISLISKDYARTYFKAGETRVFSNPMTIPFGSGGWKGSIEAWVDDPTGVRLASGNVPLEIETAKITYAAVLKFAEEGGEAPTPTEGLIGDLNDDGIVSITDSLILKQYLVGAAISELSPLSEAEFKRRADVDGDGKVTISDALMIEQGLVS